MTSQTLTLFADYEPLAGVTNPTPQQTYRNPRLLLQESRPVELKSDYIEVKMLYAGLCGTDLHLAKAHPETGYISTSAPVMIPSQGRIIGHEGVGKVVKTGSQVQHLKPGNLVTFESIMVCRFCDACRKGYFNQCRHARLIGLEEDGLFANKAHLPASLAHNITDMAEDDHGLQAAACFEPAGVAYVACEAVRPGGAERVVIFGAGPIGLFSAMLWRRVFGARMIHIVEPVPFRREFARQFCDRVYDVEEYFETFRGSMDVLVEASGNLDNVQRAFPFLDVHGQVVLLARSGQPLYLDAVDHMITNAIGIVGSRGHLGGAFDRIRQLYHDGVLPLTDVITKIVPGLNGLLDLMTTGNQAIDNNCKVLVRF